MLQATWSFRRSTHWKVVINYTQSKKRLLWVGHSTQNWSFPSLILISSFGTLNTNCYSCRNLLLRTYAVSSARLATIQDTIRETSCPASDVRTYVRMTHNDNITITQSQQVSPEDLALRTRLPVFSALAATDGPYVRAQYCTVQVSLLMYVMTKSPFYEAKSRTSVTSVNSHRYVIQVIPQLLVGGLTIKEYSITL